MACIKLYNRPVCKKTYAFVPCRALLPPLIGVKALELLAVLMVDGPEGYRAVLAAMDYFKLVKGERVRFYSLLDALMTDEADLAFKRDVMLFINTLVNRCGNPYEYRDESVSFFSLFFNIRCL